MGFVEGVRDGITDRDADVDVLGDVEGAVLVEYEVDADVDGDTLLLVEGLVEYAIDGYVGYGVLEYVIEGLVLFWTLLDALGCAHKMLRKDVLAGVEVDASDKLRVENGLAEVRVDTLG